MGEMIEFPSNGSVGQGYLATPPGGGPGVVVIQEWWGLVPHIKDVCDRFASEGFTALAPDLYRGKEVSEPDEAGKAAMAMEAETAVRDMSGAVDELRRRAGSEKVAVVGFCMGGGLALTLASRRPDAVVACVPFYGVSLRPDLQPDYSSFEAAVLGHYAELDQYCTPDAARALEARLKGLGREAEMHIYPGVDHAFFNDTRPEVYDAEASATAWKRTIDFLHSHLG
ncbi:MAG TPA: dienelactone hydrolase family protein [Acidimicrobiales bacterium]|nr:dienelactone hydrolase family protein [Acidimicrobiales bacterium]